MDLMHLFVLFARKHKTAFTPQDEIDEQHIEYRN